MKFFVIAIALSVPAFAELPSFLEDLPAVPALVLHRPDPGIQVIAPEAKAVKAAPPVFPKNTRALIRSAAEKHQVPAAFVKSIVAAESNFDPAAISPKGAIGLMQLMPATAEAYGADPHIPEQNVEAGTRYLRELMERYRRSRDWLRRVIAAYNAGPAMVDRYRGVPPFPETRQYVARVLGFLRTFQHERM